MFHLRGRILILSVMTAMLISCNISTSLTSTPTPPRATVTPGDDTTPDWYPLPTVLHYVAPVDAIGYTHFTPSKTSKIRLEFDYPQNWIFAEHSDAAGLPHIFLGDARFLSLATPAPDDYHPTSHDLGSISIWIFPTKPGETVESRAETQKQIYRDAWWATFLYDYKLPIDGYGARVIEHHVQVPEIDASLMFERRIYFYAGNEIYEITFEVAEKDRGGDFELGYDFFFRSLKVLD